MTLTQRPFKQQLYLTEIFASVQGETTFAGLPTTFIRLSGCNLRCSWCDTSYSFKRGDLWTIDAIIDKVDSHGLSHVCITGGEPLLQTAVHHLMERLCEKKFILNLETGGSLTIEEVDPRVMIVLDVKCPGSLMAKKNYWDNFLFLKHSDEVKFVIKDRLDYNFAVKICEDFQIFSRVRTVLFQPVFDVLPAKELASWIIADRLPVRFSLQVHKYIWDPLTKGV